MRKALFASMVLLILVSLVQGDVAKQEVTFQGIFQKKTDRFAGSPVLQWVVSVDKVISGPTSQKGSVIVFVPGLGLSKASVDSEIKKGDRVKVRGEYCGGKNSVVCPLEKSHYVKKMPQKSEGSEEEKPPKDKIDRQEITFQGTFIKSKLSIGVLEWLVTVDRVISGPTPQKSPVAVIVAGGVMGEASIESDIEEGDMVKVHGYYLDGKSPGVNPTEKSHYVKELSLAMTGLGEYKEEVKGVVKIFFSYDFPKDLDNIGVNDKNRYIVKVDDEEVLDAHTLWNQKARPPVAVGLFNRGELKLYNNKSRGECYKNFLKASIPKYGGPKRLEGSGEDEFYLSSHFFENGEHEVTLKVACGVDGSGKPKYCQDSIRLDFQNEYKAKDWHPKVGFRTKSVTFQALEDYAVKEKAKEIAEQLNERAGDEGIYIRSEAAAGYQFAGDQWICRKQAFRVLKLVDIAGTVYSVFQIGTAATAKEAVKEALWESGEHIIGSVLENLASIYVKRLFKDRGLNYKVFPGGDLEGLNGNRRVLLLHFYERQQAINTFFPYSEGSARLAEVTWDHVVPMYLDKGSGEWKFLFLREGAAKSRGKKVGFTAADAEPKWGDSLEELRWYPEAKAIEWIKRPSSIPSGGNRKFKFEIKENVAPNLRTMGMHLALELPKGVKISEVEVQDAIGTKFGSEVKRVGALGYVTGTTYEQGGKSCSFRIHSASSVKGDGDRVHPYGKARRVIINIPYVNSYYEGVKETVSFSLTRTKEDANLSDVKYSLVPGSYHNFANKVKAGYVAGESEYHYQQELLTSLTSRSGSRRFPYPAFYYPAQLQKNL